MGVDAEMFVKWRGQPLTEREVRALAGRMTAVMGVNPFYTKFPSDSEPKGRHALSLAPTEKEWLEECARDYGLAAYPDPVATNRQVITQDGEPIFSQPGEQFIKVHFMGRYYGPGYERGDWNVYRGVYKFLTLNLAGCEVWYGGDSSGVTHYRLLDSVVDHLDRLFYIAGHDNYVGAFSSIFSLGVPQPVCTFCGDAPMHECGGGRGMTFYRCSGCGYEICADTEKWWDLAPDRHRKSLSGVSSSPEGQNVRPISEMPTLGGVK